MISFFYSLVQTSKPTHERSFSIPLGQFTKEQYIVKFGIFQDIVLQNLGFCPIEKTECHWLNALPDTGSSSFIIPYSTQSAVNYHRSDECATNSKFRCMPGFGVMHLYASIIDQQTEDNYPFRRSYAPTKNLELPLFVLEYSTTTFQNPPLGFIHFHGGY